MYPGCQPHRDSPSGSGGPGVWRSSFSSIMKNWVISSQEDLPTLPSIGMAIKEHALSSNCTMTSMRRLVSRDPAATLLVLREANSRAYGRTGRVDNLKEAVNLLGMKGLRPLLLGLPLSGRSVPRRGKTGHPFQVSQTGP